MHFRQRVSGVLLLILLAVWGCAAPRQDRAKTWVDLSAIGERIIKAKPQATVLDESGGEQEVTAKRKPLLSKDFFQDEAGDNPYLRNISNKKIRKQQTTIEGEGILLNFDNADIYEVIQSIAEILDLNYIIDPQVKGVVNIRSGRKIPMNQLFAVFKKILNINGLDIRKEGEYDYIYKAKKLSADAVNAPGRIGDLQDSSRMVMQVVPIMHLSSAEALKLVEPYLSDHGSTYNMAGQNMLIINDFESKVIDCLVILSRLDVSPLAGIKVRLVRIEKAPLFVLHEELGQILQALRVNKRDFEGVSVVPLERVNSLLLVSGNRQLLDSAETWIRELDVVPMGGRDTIYIYNVRNSVASELAGLVNSLIEEKTSAPKSSTKKTATVKSAAKPPPPPGTSTKPGTTTSAAASTVKTGATSSALQFAGAPVLLADDTRNIILIRALPDDYSRLTKLMERLDNLPRQVLIEVLVAEVKLTGMWSMGIEWAIKNHATGKYTDNYTNAPNSSIGGFISNFEGGSALSIPQGFTYSLVSNNLNVFGLLNALATDTDFSVLASPQVMVLNNETATVNVGDQVPIATSESISDDTSVNEVRTVQYKDTGVILSVTPRINHNGIILLDIEQEVSEASGTGIETTISNRKIKTKLAVKDGQAILMGGMIKKTDNATENGIPYLKDVPVLGWFFKHKTKTVIKTELLVMITPYVVASEDVLDQYIRSFKEQVGNIRKELKSAN